MYCLKCGAKIPDGAKFCGNCGAAAEPVQNSNQQPSQGGAAQPFTVQQMPQVQPVKKKIWPWVLGIAAAVLLVLTCGAFAIKAIVDRIAVARDLEQIMDGDDMFSIDDFNDDHEQDHHEQDYHDHSAGSDSYDLEDSIEYGEYGDVTINDYLFAEVMNADGVTYIEGNDYVDNDTVLFNGKTAGDFCDYIDSEVLDTGYTIDRDLLYDLIELHLVDPALYSNNTEYFVTNMVFCLGFTYEFGNNGDLEVDQLAYYSDDMKTYYYYIEQYDKEDTWIVNYYDKYIYFNAGDTEYTSKGEYSIFADKTIGIWNVVVNEFFETK